MQGPSETSGNDVSKVAIKNSDLSLSASKRIERNRLLSIGIKTCQYTNVTIATDEMVPHLDVGADMAIENEGQVLIVWLRPFNA